MKLSIKSSVIGLSLLFTVALFGFGQKGQGGLTLPPCSISADKTKIVDTYIHFYVSNTALDTYSQSVIENDISESIDVANQILANSCIPMTRKLAQVKYIDLTEKTFSNIGQSHKALLNVVGEDEINQIRSQPNHYYGLIMAEDDNFLGPVNYGDPSFVGQTNPSVNRHYFIVTADAHLITLEHELGHLAGAQHRDTSGTLGIWLNQAYESKDEYLKPYARAYRCGDSGTIMSYESNVIFAYSSPDISYQGEVCGDPDKADNARQLREHAERIRQALLET